MGAQPDGIAGCWFNNTLRIAIAIACISAGSARQALAQSATQSTINPLQVLQQISGSEGSPQAPVHAEYSLQLTDLTAGNGQLVPGSIGIQLGVRLFLNGWEALEVEYQLSEHGGTLLLSPGTAGSAQPAVNLNLQRLSAQEVLTLGSHSHINPFVLCGGGAAQFTPQRAPGATPQTRPIGVAGVGVDLNVLHFGIRAEIEGLFFRQPDFRNGSVITSWGHAPQPSAGLFIRF